VLELDVRKGRADAGGEGGNGERFVKDRRCCAWTVRGLPCDRFLRARAASPHRALRFAPNRALARNIVRAARRISAHAGHDPSREGTLTAFRLALIQIFGA
jgi:hypothetical protein